LTTDLRTTVEKKHQQETSADTEQLILVDEADREIGHLNKAACHAGAGTLHRAFSLFIFNDEDQLLIQQRGARKQLWPLYWSNSCCSHPRYGESMSSAIHRRLMEELGLSCPLEFLFKFKYQAQYDGAGAEHELCSVFFGRSSTQVRSNREEIGAWRWISVPQLEREFDEDKHPFTPWFKLEWARIRQHYLDEIFAVGGARAWASP
jgi:isopentenyl-diphosphate delta-isomerase